jgi:hypothetical protein
LAESFGNLVDLVGGNQYLGVLVSPLEKLCSIEEPTVRDSVPYDKLVNGSGRSKFEKGVQGHGIQEE